MIRRASENGPPLKELRVLSHRLLFQPPSVAHRCLVFLLLLAAIAPSSGAEILPFAELEVGMNGVGRTVFSGDRIEEFKIEIVGLLENIQPQHDLILIRCSGSPLEQTGVAQGMSGSPIYVRGRLIGALAYSWGFAKEPIAGEDARLGTPQQPPTRHTGIPAQDEFAGPGTPLLLRVARLG